MTTYTDHIDAIARSVLYEGYILWPYRRSALKNQRRWTFGGVFPEAYSRSGHADDACLMRTECLMQTTADAALSVRVRFLQVCDRQPARLGANGLVMADAITVDGITHTAWQEAIEREVVVPGMRISGTSDRTVVRAPVDFGADEHQDLLMTASGAPAGVLFRRWEAITAAVDLSVEKLTDDECDGLFRVRVDVTNTSRWSGEARDRVLYRTLVATHTVLHASGGAFLSLTDPPAPFAGVAARCTNIGTWPVLVGDAPDRSTMLSSPIILPDYPRVSPESSGDFFDAAEIDQLLVLGVLSMTEDEQRQMRETDPRARAILERCQSLSPDAMLRLRGATRELDRRETIP